MKTSIKLPMLMTLYFYFLNIVDNDQNPSITIIMMDEKVSIVFPPRISDSHTCCGIMYLHV